MSVNMFMKHQSCPWCDEINDITDMAGLPVYCNSCKHRVDVEREKCDCRKCADKARLMRIREHERRAKDG